jgi:putative addiction module component (TIGR02574 family)
MSTYSLSDLRKLSVAERIQLAQDLWDSIAEDSPEGPPLTSEQKDELDRRVADAEQNPGEGRSWAEIKSRLLNDR